MGTIKKVFVIHKTHLDIGFTDSAKTVLERYMDTFIPGAIETARVCNQDGKKNFVWTVGSFLIEHYLQHGKEPERLIRAIEERAIAWHGLAVTTHTELMDGDLVRYDLSISQRLDQRFGRRTIAAKMTDVPSHTQALVPYLAEAGIQYLHVGVNGSSKLVKLPPLCRLRYGDDEVVLDYAGAYGGSSVFGEYAMEFAHTQDNMGPPQPQDVWEEIRRLQEKYPGAEIVSGTIDEFAQLVLAHKEELPVVTEELGDTWIHGAATDPYKMGAYAELLRLRDQWKRMDPSAPSTPQWEELCQNLMLVCEHTWGRDSKRWFSDYRNWEKEAFQEARKRDTVTEEDVLPAGEELREATLQQASLLQDQCRYSTLEESWEEQRAYIDQAVQALPDALQKEAQERLKALRPERAPLCVQPTQEREFAINGYRVAVQEDGSLRLLQAPGGKTYSHAWLGRLAYQVYSAKTVYDNLETYNRDLEHTRVWAEGDFAKPGLDRVQGLEDRTFSYELERVERRKDTLRLWLKADPQAAEQYGAPRQAVVSYTFQDKVQIQLDWFQKDASRIPEGIFFGVGLEGLREEQLQITKLDLPVSPYRVREGGNRKLHAATAVQCGSTKLESLHAPLLSVGGMHLYDENEAYGNLEDGLYYLLFNNRWNTNFRLWYEENASFVFQLKL